MYRFILLFKSLKEDKDIWDHFGIGDILERSVVLVRPSVFSYTAANRAIFPLVEHLQFLGRYKEAFELVDKWIKNESSRDTFLKRMAEKAIRGQGEEVKPDPQVAHEMVRSMSNQFEPLLGFREKDIAILHCLDGLSESGLSPEEKVSWGRIFVKEMGEKGKVDSARNKLIHMIADEKITAPTEENIQELRKEAVSIRGVDELVSALISIGRFCLRTDFLEEVEVVILMTMLIPPDLCQWRSFFIEKKKEEFVSEYVKRVLKEDPDHARRIAVDLISDPMIMFDLTVHFYKKGFVEAAEDLYHRRTTTHFLPSDVLLKEAFDSYNQKEAE